MDKEGGEEYKKESNEPDGSLLSCQPPNPLTFLLKISYNRNSINNKGEYKCTLTLSNLTV